MTGRRGQDSPGDWRRRTRELRWSKETGATVLVAGGDWKIGRGGRRCPGDPRRIPEDEARWPQNEDRRTVVRWLSEVAGWPEGEAKGDQVVRGGCQKRLRELDWSLT